MSRTIRVTFGALLVIVLVTTLLLTLVFANLDQLVARAIRDEGTRAAGVPVFVQTVRISIKDGSGILRNLTIGNPTGFTSPFAMKINGATVEIDKDSISRDVIVINRILVDGARINYEQTASGNNLETILDNKPGQAAADDSDSSESEVQVIVRELRFTNAKATVIAPAFAEAFEVDIPEFVIRDIGSATAGLSTDELAQKILRPVIRESMNGAIDGMTERAKDQLIEEIDDTVNRALRKGADKLRKAFE